MAVTPEAVLFDLDGTLIDSAPDLIAALDHVRAQRGLDPADRRELREHVSRGANGLLAAGLPGWEGLMESERERLRSRLLDYYEAHCWQSSAPFEGVVELLDELGRRGIRMGIVTNKISRFADPVVDRAGWSNRFGCLVTGDRVARPKPDPEPVLQACQSLGVRPECTLFVGDDRRDVDSGRAAGSSTVIAAWGYLPRDEDPGQWRAHAVIAEPSALLELIDRRETG